MKKLIASLQLNTTRGRVIILCGTFVAVFVFFAAVIYVQNKKTLAATHQTADLKFPMAMAASNMLVGVEASGNAQLSFILSKEKKYQLEREKIWSSLVEPNATKMQQLSSQMDKETKASIKSILTWLDTYAKAQQEEKKLILANADLDPTDSTAQATLQANNDELKTIIPKIGQAYNMLQGQLQTLQSQQQTTLSVDLQSIRNNMESTNQVIIFLTIFIVVAALFTGYLAIGKAQQSIDMTTEMIAELASGKLHTAQTKVSGEMTAIVNAGNQLKENLRKAVEFASAIGEGNFRLEFQPSSEHDVLGQALVAMRNKLENVAEEDRKRNWTIEGLAKFAEILRSHTDVTELANAIIQNLAKYIHANQGGLFIVEEDAAGTLYLKLTACFAYERRKFLQKEIAIGEGLAGQVYLEKETIYLTSIPEDYINIRSGLGNANPKSLLVVPLKNNDKIEGVIELASFQKLEPYEIEFVEKLAETIASTLSSAKLAQHSQQLLAEFRQQAEQMRMQEEELRQNMEELLATQEEIERREQSQYDSIDDELSHNPYYYPGNENE